MDKGILERMEAVQGDLTGMKVDAIVNAANSSLLGGGGVDGAIHRAAGPELLAECRKIKGGCPTGQARITKGYNLPAKFVIHTVGPVYSGTGKDPELLSSCYRESLKLAGENGCKTVAFPAISCGVFGYPIAEAAEVAVEAVADFLQSDDFIQKVYFVLFSGPHLAIYRDILNSF